MSAKRIKRAPLVAIVGRANAGKSTLWNRITETGRAIVSAEPHTTRDRNEAKVVWRGAAFDCVDTGGLDADQGSAIGRGIKAQAEQAVREADLVIFLFDARQGATELDRDFAREIKKLNKHTIAVGNKLEDLRFVGDVYTQTTMAMGLGEPLSCSASTGKGVGDLLDRINEDLIKYGTPPVPVDDELGLKIVVMGRANVGKSSLINAILGEDRVIVSPIAHTTREPIDTTFDVNGERVTLIDTAGLRQRSSLKSRIDEAAMERNREALDRADMAFLVVDANEPPAAADKHLAGLMKSATKGLIIVANKWDLVEDKLTGSTDEYEMKIRRALPFLRWAPIMFVSAEKHQRTNKLLDMAFKIREERRRQISYNALQRILKNVIKKKKPLAEAGPFSPHIHDVAQVGIEPPTFIITVRGNKASVHESWVRYFENHLRDKFSFEGTPIRVNVRIAHIEQRSVDREGKKFQHRRKRPIGRKGNRY